MKNLKSLLTISFLLAACSTQLMMQPQQMEAHLFGLTNTAAALATGNAVATNMAVATEDAARRQATAIVMEAQANGTAHALEVMPTLTLAAATSTAGWETQTVRETLTAYPLTATPAAARMLSEVQDVERRNSFWNSVNAMCVGILLAGTIVAVALIAKSRTFAPIVMADVRLLLALLIEHRRQQNALALVRTVPGSKELYTVPGANGLEVHSLAEGSGPVIVDLSALTRAWRLAVWRLCEAEAAVGTFAGDELARHGVIANDADNWQLLTDVMSEAGILAKRERSRTRYADGWNLDRIRAERDSLALPHPNRMPPAVNFALEGQLQAV